MDTTEAADDVPAVILLDFMKAYGTLNREFLILTLQQFGFATDFVQLIDRIREHTSARFMENDELSGAIP